MAPDPVRIHPDFRPSPPDHDRGRWLRRIGVLAVVMAALIFGWLLRSPTRTGPEPVEDAAVTGTTAASGLDVPLGEAVPGFTDTVTVLTWNDHGEGVARWRPTQQSLETTVLFDHQEPIWRINGLDASGRWYALRTLNGELSVHPVEHEIEARPLPLEATVDVEVRSYVWHDTEPGRLAWVTCPSASTTSPGTLYTLDANDGAAEPIVMRLVEDACKSPTWLDGWGDWGMLVQSTAGADDPVVEEVLFDGEGTQIALGRFAPGHAYFVAGGPDGNTIWTADPLGPDTSSFLLSADGQRRTPVPGLVAGEWLDDAVWSPDGHAIALLVQEVATVTDPTLRIVEATTGAVTAEIEETGWVAAKAWSPNGRFLVYERWHDVLSNWAGVPQNVELVFYDTATDARVGLPLPRYAADIRVYNP